jgi:hypothetical protein
MVSPCQISLLWILFHSSTRLTGLRGLKSKLVKTWTTPIGLVSMSPPLSDWSVRLAMQTWAGTWMSLAPSDSLSGVGNPPIRLKMLLFKSQQGENNICHQAVEAAGRGLGQLQIISLSSPYFPI